MALKQGISCESRWPTFEL